MTQARPPLTSTQEAILRYIAVHIDTHGFQPSLREIADRFKIRTPNGVRSHLVAMESKGYLSLSEGSARAIEFPWKQWRV